MNSARTANPPTDAMAPPLSPPPELFAGDSFMPSPSIPWGPSSHGSRAEPRFLELGSRDCAGLHELVQVARELLDRLPVGVLVVARRVGIAPFAAGDRAHYAAL